MIIVEAHQEGGGRKGGENGNNPRGQLDHKSKEKEKGGEMSWRNHSTHKEETKAIKVALKEAGIPFTKVGHGTGSGWSWLKIYLGTRENYNKHGDHALAIARRVTGRKGDYNGETLVLAQRG